MTAPGFNAASTVVAPHSLREFVYLDEVSVLSLTSSPDLPPPLSLTETADDSFEANVNAQVEGGMPSLAKANVGTAFTSNAASGRQIERQYNLQSHFSRLHRTFSSQFLTHASPVSGTVELPEEVDAALEVLYGLGLALPPQFFERGRLAEFRVSLHAHHAFDFATFVRLTGDLMAKYPSLLGSWDMSDMSDILDGGAMIDDLMENLIPIEGLSVSHGTITSSDGTPWVVDVRVLTPRSWQLLSPSQIRVVGVAEAGLFWKDTRRLLHSASDFDVLGRISRSGLASDWTPIKVVDTFKRVVPQASQGLVDAIDALRDLSGAVRTDVEGQPLVDAAERLGELLREAHSLESFQIGNAARSRLISDPGSIEDLAGLLNTVTEDFYNQNPDLERDEDYVALLRDRVMRAHAETPSQLDAAPPRSEPSRQPLAIEMEFVAIYW